MNKIQNSFKLGERKYIDQNDISRRMKYYSEIFQKYRIQNANAKCTALEPFNFIEQFKQTIRRLNYVFMLFVNIRPGYLLNCFKIKRGWSMETSLLARFLDFPSWIMMFSKQVKCRSKLFFVIIVDFCI